MNDPTNKAAFCDPRSFRCSLAPLALFALSLLISGCTHSEKTAPTATAATTAHSTPDDSKSSNAPVLSKIVDNREPLSAVADAPTSRQEPAGGKKSDQTGSTGDTPKSDERFPNTPLGHALHQHLLTLVDVSAGADERKSRSLEELRKDAKEASELLLAAYRHEDSKNYFGRWLLSVTLSELKTNETYAALSEIAKSEIPTGLKDNDREGSALSNESAIRQSAAEGLAQLARAGNAAAEKDLLSLAIRPPSGDNAVRTVAIKGYLAAGRDYAARVRTMKAQLPKRYHDVVTLTVSPPEPVAAPNAKPAAPRTTK